MAVEDVIAALGLPESPLPVQRDADTTGGATHMLICDGGAPHDAPRCTRQQMTNASSYDADLPHTCEAAAGLAVTDPPQEQMDSAHLGLTSLPTMGNAIQKLPQMHQRPAPITDDVEMTQAHTTVAEPNLLSEREGDCIVAPAPAPEDVMPASGLQVLALSKSPADTTNCHHSAGLDTGMHKLPVECAGGHNCPCSKSPGGDDTDSAASHGNSGPNNDEPINEGHAVGAENQSWNVGNFDVSSCLDGIPHVQAESSQGLADASAQHGPGTVNRQLPHQVRIENWNVHQTPHAEYSLQNRGTLPCTDEAAPDDPMHGTGARSAEDQQIHMPKALRKPVLSFSRNAKGSTSVNDTMAPVCSNINAVTLRPSTTRTAEMSTEPPKQPGLGSTSTGFTESVHDTPAAQDSEDPIEACTDDVEGFVDALIHMSGKHSRATLIRQAQTPAISRQKPPNMHSVGPKLRLVNSAVARSGCAEGEDKDMDHGPYAASGSDVVRLLSESCAINVICPMMGLLLWRHGIGCCTKCSDYSVHPD